MSTAHKGGEEDGKNNEKNDSTGQKNADHRYRIVSDYPDCRGSHDMGALFSKDNAGSDTGLRTAGDRNTRRAHPGRFG